MCVHVSMSELVVNSRVVKEISFIVDLVWFGFDICVIKETDGI